jgi:hypothetical protein
MNHGSCGPDFRGGEPDLEQEPDDRQQTPAPTCFRCGSGDVEDRTPQDGVPRHIRHYRCRRCDSHFLRDPLDRA